MKRMVLVCAVLLAGCGVLRFPGGSSEYDLAWVFEVDTNSRTASAELSTASTGAAIARCQTGSAGSIIDAVKDFQFQPVYELPASTGAPTKVFLRSGDQEIGSCTVYNLKAWETLVALRSKV